MTGISWANMSRDDLARIDRHDREISPALADEINLRIVESVAILATLPRAGPSTERCSRRKWRVANTPYILFYRVMTDHVRVLRIVHGARDRATRL